MFSTIQVDDKILNYSTLWFGYGSVNLFSPNAILVCDKARFNYSSANAWSFTFCQMSVGLCI